jgi:hypothetical protein
LARVYGDILIAGACSVRDVQAIEAAFGHHAISERPVTADQWAAEPTTQVEAATIVDEQVCDPHCLEGGISNIRR